MRSMSRTQRVLAFALMLFFAACQATPNARPTAGSSTDAPRQTSTGKRLTAVIMGNPPTFSSRFNPTTGSVPGLDVMELRGAMLDRHARYVPVMDGTTLQGVVSFHDVAKAVYEEQSFENRMLKSYIKD